MEPYLHNLIANKIPIPHWGVIIIWLIIFICGHVLFRKNRALSRVHNLFVTVEAPEYIKPQSVKILFIQILFAAGIFAFATLYGGPAFEFIAGGWVVTSAVSIPINLHGILFSRALSRPDAVEGSVRLAATLVVKAQAFELLGAAVFCLVLGALLAHLALLGGALFISATAFGYLGKSKPQTEGEALA